MESSPSSSSRRRFLTGVVGGAVVGAVGVSAATVLGAATRNTRGGGLVQYRGMNLDNGPAPRALPQVPIGVDEDGFLYGKWPKSTGEGDTMSETEFGGVRYSADWFRFCGFEDYSGFAPNANVDTYLRSAPDLPYEWQSRTYEPGERLNIEHFDEYDRWGNQIGETGNGKPALATWRWSRTEDKTASTGQERSDRSGSPFLIQVVRSTQVHEMREQADEWLDESTTHEGFISWGAACTYDCATTGFKAHEGSEKFSAADQIFCPDCQSVFHPFDIVEAEFIAPSWEGTDDRAK